MSPTLVICSPERLDAVLHRGTVPHVLTCAEDVPRAVHVEVVAPDGRWRLFANIDRANCHETPDGRWVIAFDRRSAVIEALAVPREVAPLFVARMRS